MEPGPWTLSVDQVHGPGPSKYGQDPLSLYFNYRRCYSTLKMQLVNNDRIKINTVIIFNLILKYLNYNFWITYTYLVVKVKRHVHVI